MIERAEHVMERDSQYIETAGKPERKNQRL